MINVRCTCPRALILSERRLLQNREYKRRSDARLRAGGTPLAREVRQLQPTAKVRMPDLHLGACQDKWGFDLINSVDGFGKGVSMRRRQVREMCAACPVFTACETWVLAAEEPAGNWGGMIAGMTPGDRVRRGQR